MSGHSKWANIKRKKQANDQVRGTVFSKLSRLITLAVIEGGGITDPEHNIKLRLSVEKAKQFNMPKENIQRAIERGSGPNKDLLKEVIYEAFGPYGVAMLILATTDNPNRTLSEIRNVLDRNGGKLGNQGSVGYLFQKAGLITFKKNEVGEDDVLAFAEKIGAFDIDQDSTHFSLYFPFANLGRIKEYLNNLKYDSAEIDFKPSTSVPISGEGEAKKILNLVDVLEGLDDVQRVFANFDIPDHYLN